MRNYCLFWVGMLDGMLDGWVGKILLGLSLDWMENFVEVGENGYMEDEV